MPSDYSGQNLRGRSFKGQNLEGANFRGADIRGADFSNGKLRGANFSHTKAGLQKRWVTFLVLVSWLLSALSGFLSALVGYFAAQIFDGSNLTNQITSLTAIIAVAIFSVITIRQGIQRGFGAFAFIFAFLGAVAGAFAFATAVTGTVPGDFTGAFIVAGGVAGAVAGTFAFTGAFTVAGAFAFLGAGTFAFTVVGAFVIAVFIAEGFAGAFTIAFAVSFAVAVMLLSIYISWRAIKGDEKHALIRNIAVTFAATGGTSFHNADLTDANFTEARFKSTDFRKAILTRTCFYKTKKLDRVRPGTTYLHKALVCQVLATGQGQDKKFDREDLRGVNFKGANLVDASFIGADLSEANLQDADLSRAKLIQAQLDGTDFTGATLTGAYIEDWGITSDTKFDGVRCEYVYMRLPTKENPDPLRKPDNREEVFVDGEFGDFIKPIFDTLDLYHNQGVDPRAIAISFKQLAENHPDAELEIVAMEKRGQDKFLLRAKTSSTADKSELSTEYFTIYNELKALAKQELKALMEEKDIQIRRLENMVMTALERPSFYAETYHNQGDTMSEKSENSTYNLNNAKFGGGFAGTGGTQTGGTFYDYSSNQNLTEAAAQIQQLLQQLQQTNPSTTETEKIIVAAKAADEIKNNPTLKARVLGALKSGGKEALKEAVDNPIVNVLVAIIEGWQEAQ